MLIQHNAKKQNVNISIVIYEYNTMKLSGPDATPKLLLLLPNDDGELKKTIYHI